MLTLPDQEQLAAANRVNLKRMGNCFPNYPLWSYALNRRVRLSGFNGDWLFAVENDGKSAVPLPLYIGQVTFL